MIHILFISFLIAVGSFTFVCILQQPGELFSWFPVFMERLPKWLSKPLGMCEKCFAGQAALWLFPFWLSDGPYDPVMHILFTLLTIFLTDIIKKTYLKFFIIQSPKKGDYIPPEIL